MLRMPISEPARASLQPCSTKASASQALIAVVGHRDAGEHDRQAPCGRRAPGQRRRALDAGGQAHGARHRQPRDARPPRRPARSPSGCCASRRARRPAAPPAHRCAPAPIWIPNANRPVASSGRCANAVFTSTGASTLPIAMPMPIGSVRAITPSAPGIKARAMPASPIVNSTIVMARVAPTRAASGPAAGANTPMQKQRDRQQQPGDRVGDAEIAVDRVHERADGDDLGPQRERRKHDSGSKRGIRKSEVGLMSAPNETRPLARTKSRRHHGHALLHLVLARRGDRAQRPRLDGVLRRRHRRAGGRARRRRGSSSA